MAPAKRKDRPHLLEKVRDIPELAEKQKQMQAIALRNVAGKR